MHRLPIKTPRAAFILAGGKSARMGEDKAFVMLNGRTLLERALDLAQSVTNYVRIVGNAAKFESFAPVVEDIFTNCGPLGGIHAALRASTAELNLILAVDLPFVDSALVRKLIAQAESSADSIVIVPRTSEGWQPLCAVYRREFAEAAEAAIRAGQYKIDALFSQVQVRVVDERQLADAGFSSQIFRNLNTQEELAAAGGTFAKNQRQG